MAGSAVIPKEVVDQVIKPNRGWRVILLNDDVNDFAVVILALQKAAGLSLEVAEMVAVEAHETGSAVVKRGLNEEEAHLMVVDLKRYSRIEGITPGVDSVAEQDDDG
jgi:ATP-dependent Clp protease adapter protein ClpS